MPHVAKLDEAELRRLTSISELAWVAEDSGRVLGYLMAMSDSAAYEGEEFRWFRGRFDRPFLYIDQVAVDPEARRAQIARRLYAHAERWGLQFLGAERLCCEVNLRPANAVSMRFHEGLGFAKVQELETADGRLVALMCKDIAGGDPSSQSSPSRGGEENARGL